ncbi:MAG: SpoIIE family protein phosphatase [Balneolaceae bacterium]|nr:SpoIIE family protein phosphatase [Balneolaceae bacterium]
MNRYSLIIFIWGLLSAFAQDLHAQDTFFQFADELEVLTPDAMLNEDSIIFIQDRWKFKAGDDPERAAQQYDDSDWVTISTNLIEPDLSFLDFEGIGWFRKDFKVDEKLSGKPIALIIDRHLGASEIYLNGEKIYELGNFSTEPAEVISYNSKKPVPIVFNGDEIQTMAVRFINPDYAMTGRLMGYNGFRFLLGDWSVHQNQNINFLAQWTGSNMFYIGMLMAFSVIHLLLFLFYPGEKRNLYFAVFVAFLGIFTYLIYRAELAENTVDTLFFIRSLVVSEVLVLTFAARFTHSIDKLFSAVFSNSLVVFGVFVSVLIWNFPEQLIWLRELAVIIFIVEILRSLLVMFYRNRGDAWVLGTGVLIFIAAIFYAVLINFNYLSGSIQIANMAGSGALVLSMSIFLSRNVAQTQKNLQTKLTEVKILSDKTIEQERLSKEREIEKRLLQAENDRKTNELEEARALQLSMLPKEMPKLPGCDMAVYMKTATEVGGDYYDYSVGNDGSLVLALGDATGHGMKAGIMVAAAKSYFHSLVHQSDGSTLLSRMSKGLFNMNMRMMYMGMMLAQVSSNRLEISTAGMPPALLYRKGENIVEKITLKALPLGSSVEYPYKSKSVNLEAGDMLLMMSDGLTELFNPNREMLGMKPVEEVLIRSGHECAEKVIGNLKQLIDEWLNGSEPHDDITLLVFRCNRSTNNSSPSVTD